MEWQNQTYIQARMHAYTNTADQLSLLPALRVLLDCDTIRALRLLTMVNLGVHGDTKANQ